MTYKTRIRIPIRQRLDLFRRGPLTFVVWIASLAAAGWLYHNQTQCYEYVGLARSMQYEVSPATSGLIENLLVDLFSPVTAGDIVATLDTSLLAAELATASMTVERLGAEMAAAQFEIASSSTRTAGDWEADLRRFQEEEEGRRLEALALRVTLESDRIEKQRLMLELDRHRQKADSGIGAVADLDNVRMAHDRVVKRIEENTILLAQTEQAHRTARSRREEFVTRRPEFNELDQALRPFQLAIKEQERVVDEIRARLAKSVLRSPVSGKVVEVASRQGQAVTVGTPVALIVANTVSDIIFYARETDMDRIAEGAHAQIASSRSPNMVVESVITRTGNSVERLPERLWQTPQQPEYGFPFQVSAVSCLQLVPGETVRVRIAGNI